MFKRINNISSSNNGDNNKIIIKDYDDDYYIEIGEEPPRFADYRAARTNALDTITQDELDYFLKLKLRTTSPEERYQEEKKHTYFHDKSWYMNTDKLGIQHDSDDDRKWCDRGYGCVPECRYYPAYGRIEDEEVIQRHRECEQYYRKKNAIVEPPSPIDFSNLSQKNSI